MEELVKSVLAKLAEYLVDPTLQQLQYLFCVGKITRNVEIRKEELILKQGKVQERVQEAINRTERIDDEVNKWKNDVKSLIAEVEKSEEELRTNKGCLRWWCPIWRRYRLYKKLVETTQMMNELNTKSDHFNKFSHHVIAPDIDNHFSQNFKFFSSTQMAYNQMWEALQDDDSSIIGLWGMGGSGKTTLVTEVKKKAKDSKLFDQVVLTTISQNPQIRNIQGEIADTLGLKLEEESNKGRANRIALRLQSGERILIILDDVWTKLNLEDIGIPFGRNYRRSCKVVLTTRRLTVCASMDCQKTIKLDLLNEDESWTLFNTYANVDDVAKVVARAIAMECKGLPIAIVALGTCLKGKRVEEMNEMLHRLRNAKLNDLVDEDVRDAYRCLELSYAYLPTREAKLLLLMCAMFPEDHIIAVEDLFIYGVALGLCKNVDSFGTARSEVSTTINFLFDSSLLMKWFNVHTGEYVKLHDMVRDVALWIASKEDRTIMVNCSKELDKLIVDEAINDCYAFSSWSDNLRLLQFPSQLDTSKLEFLLLCSKTLLDLDIPHTTFKGTKGLKTLVIMCTNYPPKIEFQPQSIQHLSNLRTLRLQNSNLHDISFVVSLTRLEILDLQGSEFARVPNGIENLNRLKLLDLSRCTINECCYKVIGKCSQLEELYVSTHFPHPGNTNCYEYLGESTTLMNLRRYNLEIGELPIDYFFLDESTRSLSTRSLSLGKLNISMLGAIFKDILQRATVITFYEFQGGSKSFMANIVQAVGSMSELIKLSLDRCWKIECIMDETTPHGDAAVTRLNELMLRNMDNLRQLCLGPSPFSLFQKLERLSILNCPQLLHIFPANCNLVNLKFLKISNCPMLTAIFPVSIAYTLSSLSILNCPQLLHIFPANCNLVNLKFLKISSCPMLTSIFPVSIAYTLSSLEQLVIADVPQMKFVFGENASEEQLIHDQDKTQIVLCLLEYLILQYLPNLVGICPGGYCLRWPSMKLIKWRNCPNMELQELKCHQVKNEEYEPLTAIEMIELDDCGVESIFHYQIGVEEQIPTFQYLRVLTLTKCARLKFVFSSHICQSLPELTSVTISYCEELEAIFSGKEETQKNISIIESCVPMKLTSLEICHCDKLKYIFSFMISAATSMLPQLGMLFISYCSQMEEIFKCSNIEDRNIDSEREITFPNMKYMKLENLPRLVNVFEGFKLHIGGFCSVMVHDCPKFMPIKSIAIDWTEEGLVRNYESNYSQLSNNEALNLLPSILIAGELDIQSARVEHKWRVIGDKEQEETIDSGMLRSDQQIPRGLVPTQFLSFQHLYALEVTHFKRLKFLFSMSTIVQNNLPKLNSLTLSDCEELEVIFGHSSEDDANYSGTIVLSSLKKIELRNLPNFISICQVGLRIQGQPSDITICNSPKFVDSSLGSAPQQLEKIPELQKLQGRQLRNDEYNPWAAIERIQLDNGGIESFFHYQIGAKEQFPTFQYLKELTLKKCAKLKFVFSVHIYQSLPELTSVTISSCKELEAVFSRNEETKKNQSITESCLLKLKSLTISRCNKLKFVLSFLSSAASSMLPQLSTLTISYCSQMEDIFKCSNIEDHDIESYREITCPNMNLMELENLPRLVNVCKGFKLHTKEFCEGFKLHTEGFYRVEVHDCPKLLPLESAIMFWTKEKVVRKYALKYSQLNNNDALCLPISVLNVGELDVQSAKVEHNWQVIGDDDQEETSDSEMLRSEEQMLGGLVPTKVLSFQYLYSLEVTHYKKLKFLFSMSTIVHNSLPKLTSLTLFDCEELEEIITENEEHQIMCDVQVGLPELRELTVEGCNKLKRLFSTSTSTLVLPSLREIELINLPNFMCLCQGLQIQVQLSDIIICSCPKFVDLSLRRALQQLGTLVSLPQVSTEDSNLQISSNVEQLSGNEGEGMKMLNSRTEFLSLEDSINLTTVWEGPTFVMFQNLKELEVTKCRRLKCIFPSTVIRSLPCLKDLWIEECEELEEVMSSEEEHNHFPNESSNSSLCFPKLKRLEVIRCRKLKWLFPSLPSTLLLPRLKRLRIEECSQLKGICNSEVEIHEESSYNNALPKLNYLTVNDCPIFSKTTLAALQSCERQNQEIISYDDNDVDDYYTYDDNDVDDYYTDYDDDDDDDDYDDDGGGDDDDCDDDGDDVDGDVDGDV